MRPPAPKAGHRVWLERWGLVWRSVSFSGKMILRNVSRYKVRTAITIFGVMCATAILLVGRFAGDAMDYLISYHFDKFQRQDVRVDFYAERDMGALLDASRFPHVRAAEPELDYPFTVKAGWRKKDIAVTGLAADVHMLDLTRADGRPVKLGEDGLVIAEHIAEDLRLRPGDIVVMKPLLGKTKRESTVRIRDVVQQYLGTGAYMNIRALSRLLDEPFAVNAVLLRVEQGREGELNRYLKDVPAVAAVEAKKESRRKIEETLAASMAISNLFMTVFSGVIAFAIIYNSTSISLTERTRDLASLRVLGFKLSELRRIVFGENVLLSAAGTALGMGVGTLLCMWMVSAYQTDVYRFPFHISASTFVASGLSIAVFVLIANLASRRRIARLDMVEVLKAQE
jgi:putative ABC transport system permease protein